MFAWVYVRERVTVCVYECVLGTSAPLLIFQCSQDLVVSRLCLTLQDCHVAVGGWIMGDG